MMSKEQILELVRKVDQQQSFCDGEREGLKSLYDSVAGFEMRPDALKTALKLRKLKPDAMAAWLRTFDAARDALELDAQMDLEDVIAEKEAADTSAGKRGRRNGQGRHEPLPPPA